MGWYSGTDNRPSKKYGALADNPARRVFCSNKIQCQLPGFRMACPCGGCENYLSGCLAVSALNPQAPRSENQN
jgi:hypothetical protein